MGEGLGLVVCLLDGGCGCGCGCEGHVASAKDTMIGREYVYVCICICACMYVGIQLNGEFRSTGNVLRHGLVSDKVRTAGHGRCEVRAVVRVRCFSW